MKELIFFFFPSKGIFIWLLLESVNRTNYYSIRISFPLALGKKKKKSKENKGKCYSKVCLNVGLGGKSRVKGKNLSLRWSTHFSSK